MKTGMKKFLPLIALALALVGCGIEEPDYFVPEVAFTEADTPIVFDAAGGSRELTIEANCDWSVTCPAEWVELSTEAGLHNGSLTIVVGATKLPRSTTVTLYSNEVEERSSVISISQGGVVEISSVSAAVASNLASASGTTATLTANYTGISIAESDVVTAGFTLTPQSGGDDFEVAATVDRTAESFSADLTGLTPGETYRCVAWAQLNDDPRVSGEPMTFAPELLPTELQSVGQTVASGIKSDTGTTASLESSFVAVSLGADDVITAGFVLTPADGTPIDVPATVDIAASTFRADVTDLIPGTSYSCVAWASLNGAPRVEGPASEFTPSLRQALTIEADFSENTLWGLPEKNSDMVQSEVVVTDPQGYTWKIFGGCINSGCLWLACQGKSGFNGYVITPQLDDMTVTSISFPNDGPAASGKARITISVSDDGGNSFTPIAGCTEVACGTFELTGQKPGCIYKIENVDAGGTNGYSKTVKLTIHAE